MKAKYHHGDLKVELIKTGLQMIQEKGIENLSLRNYLPCVMSAKQLHTAILKTKTNC